MTVAGTVDTFPLDAYVTSLAAALGVAPSDCNVTVVAASVSVFVTVYTPSQAVSDRCVHTNRPRPPLCVVCEQVRHAHSCVSNAPRPV